MGLVPNPNQLRLGIHLLLSSEFVAAFFAVVCSSYVPVNRGSTGRSLMTPLGNEDYPHVRRSNKMTSRTFQEYGIECCFYINLCFFIVPEECCLWFMFCSRSKNKHGIWYCILSPQRSVILMYLAVVARGNFFMENPMNSLIAQHPRYVWMVEHLMKFGIYVSDL